jgi:cysteine synthase A
MQGWSPDFIPLIAEQVIDNECIDKLISINGNAALICAKEPAKKKEFL